MENIEQEDIKLRKALKSLQEYSPSNALWPTIANILDESDTEQNKLQIALSRLPIYEPASTIWGAIEKEIQPTPKYGRVFYLKTFAAAASFLALLFAGSIWYQIQSSSKDSTSYSYYTEKTDEAIITINSKENQEDEAAFALVNEICEKQAFICEQPQVKLLKSELDELNHAHAALKEAIGSYGSDIELRQQLSQIELDRTEILKKIMNEI